MAEFIRIKGWAKYQHYKDRNPPWIKLHRELLTSLTWAMADDASRVLAIACMLLAAATDNKIPADPAYVKRVAYLNTEPDFSVLIKLDFLELVDDKGKVIVTAITPLADASKLQAHARPEAEKETDAEKRNTKPSARKARGAEVNNSQVARAAAETRHSRLHQLVMNWYQDWAGVECPWDGSEGRNLKRLIDSTPNWPDQQFVTCLENLSASDCVPKGDRPREWLEKLPKFLHGPLDQYWKPKGVSNGSGSRQANKADARDRKPLENVLAYRAATAGATAGAGNGEVAVSRDGETGVRGLDGEPEIIPPEKNTGSARPIDGRPAKA